MARGVKSAEKYRKRRRRTSTRTTPLSSKKKLTKAEQISQIPIQDIGKLSGDEGMNTLKKYVTTLRAGYNRRVSSFKNRGLVSHAQIMVEESMPKDEKGNIVIKPIKEMSRNQLIAEFARMQKFFGDVTSSVQGIKKVNIEQDRRIFGTDKRGRPLDSMTSKQRENFWAAYDEFEHQNKTADTTYGSETIQQWIAEAMFTHGKSMSDIFTMKASDLEKLIREARESQEEIPTPEAVMNVLRGKKGPLNSD